MRFLITVLFVFGLSACTYRLSAEPPPNTAPEQVIADKEECKETAKSESSLTGRAPPDSKVVRIELFNLYSSCLTSKGYKWRADAN